MANHQLKTTWHDFINNLFINSGFNPFVVLNNIFTSLSKRLDIPNQEFFRWTFHYLCRPSKQ